MERLVCKRINWQPKSINIIELARDLNIRTDSFLHIDDSPYEISEVSSSNPLVDTFLFDPLSVDQAVGQSSHILHSPLSYQTKTDSVRKQHLSRPN